MAFGQIYLANFSAVQQNNSLQAQISFDTALNLQHDPQAVYYGFLDITPSLNLSEGARFHVQVYRNSTQSSVGSSGRDFKFIGSCSAAQKVCSAATPGCVSISPVRSSCAVDSEGYSVVFDYIEPVIAQRPFRIQVQIQNPIYISTRDVRIYSTSKIDGRTLEKGQLFDALRVSEIQLIKGTSRVLWGILDNQAIEGVPRITQGSEERIQLFKQSLTPSGMSGPLNSIYFGFYVGKAVPLSSQFQLELTIAATGIVDDSIITNLPNYGSNKVKCHYAAPKLVCRNVGAFVNKNREYFIALKAYWANSVSAITQYGQIKLTSIVNDDKGNACVWVCACVCVCVWVGGCVRVCVRARGSPPFAPGIWPLTSSIPPPRRRA